jgi:hypothetical protein
MTSRFFHKKFWQSSWRVSLVAVCLIALVCDLIFLANPQQRIWHQLAFYGIGGGLMLASVVVVAGFVAWLRIADPHWRAIGAAHVTAYLMMALLLGLSLALRTGGAHAMLAVILSGVAIVLFLSSTWIDDELDQIYRQRHTVSWSG